LPPATDNQQSTPQCLEQDFRDLRINRIFENNWQLISNNQSFKSSTHQIIKKGHPSIDCGC